MFNFMLTAPATEGGLLSNISPILLMVVMLGVMYFMLIRPQRKKEKEQRDMRGSVEVGDGVTTIGGIIGRVVSIKDDTIIIESGADRNKIRFQKWAIQDVEKLNLESKDDTKADKTEKADKAEKTDKKA